MLSAPLELLTDSFSDEEEEEEPDVLPEEAPDEDELLLDVLELDDSLLTVKVSVLLFTVQLL